MSAPQCAQGVARAAPRAGTPAPVGDITPKPVEKTPNLRRRADGRELRAASGFDQ